MKSKDVCAATQHSQIIKKKEKRYFQIKQSSKEFESRKPILQEMLKEILEADGK